MSFLHGFFPSFGRALRSALPGRRLVVLVLVLAVPVAIAAATRSLEDSERGTALLTIQIFLYLQFLVPLCGLLFGTGILLEEANAGNLPFLFTRPVPRSSIVVGKYLAFLLVGSLALAASLGLTLAAASGAQVSEGFGGRALLSVLLAYPAYLAAFAFLSAFTRWALLGGFFYAFGVELVLGFVPGMIRELALTFYSRSLLGDWEIQELSAEEIFGAAGPATPGFAAGVLLATAGVALVLACAVIGRKQFP